MEKLGFPAYELVADKWNPPSFSPVTEVVDCHEQQIMVPIEDGSFIFVKDLAPATPQKIRDKLLTEMRTHLIHIIDD